MVKTGRKVKGEGKRKWERHLLPFAQFDFSTLDDDTLLTPAEVAAVIRFTVQALELWRRDPKHPLVWTRVNGKPRYRVGDVRAFMAGDQPAAPEAKAVPPPKGEAKAPPPARRRERSEAHP